MLVPVTPIVLVHACPMCAVVLSVVGRMRNKVNAGHVLPPQAIFQLLPISTLISSCRYPHHHGHDSAPGVLGSSSGFYRLFCPGQSSWNRRLGPSLDLDPDMPDFGRSDRQGGRRENYRNLANRAEVWASGSRDLRGPSLL